MNILYSDLTIKIDNEDMCISFICNSEPFYTPEEIVKKIVEKSNYSLTTNEWNMIYPNIQVKVESNRLLFKETGIEENRYGKPSVLVTVPSLLLKWGFISAEASEEMENSIRQSEVIKERAEKTDESMLHYQFRL